MQAIWKGPSSLKLVNYISYDVSGWAPTAAHRLTPSKAADAAKEDAWMQMCIRDGAT